MKLETTLLMVAWEVTRSCNLACVHCRASSLHESYPGEYGTERCLKILDEIASTGRPVVILTGGEPLLRKDIFDIAAYGTAKGLRMALATNGTLVTEEIARRIKESGILRVSISLDGPDAGRHDRFRGVPGAFAGAMKGIEALKKAGVEFQVNTTVTRSNLAFMQDMLSLAVRLGAAAWHVFLLVPTGRGREMAGEEIDAEEYEKTLELLRELSGKSPIQIKPTCAPHYLRIAGKAGAASGRKGGHPFSAVTRGCLGGTGFCFISHTGRVQPCGYLEIDCGSLDRQGFGEIWRSSPVFERLRNPALYGGKCGRCEYIRICGGCRARAYEKTGDYLSEEPCCIYEPVNCELNDG
ncbi:MAG: heme b synthase [Syntrophales bacterium]|nr:heme b synthase [Syntrophales bacterium]MDD5533201.1 heme b synthase [Syntrophales bacterium]HPL63769.1 heme b synthase [Syntrophales bacterium]